MDLEEPLKSLADMFLEDEILKHIQFPDFLLNEHNKFDQNAFNALLPEETEENRWIPAS